MRVVRPGVVTLPGVEGAVPMARRWAGVVLEAAGYERVDDALVVVSELVANAVRHTDSGGPGGGLLVLIKMTGADTLRIEVVDDGSTTVPCPREPDWESLNGRGLWLVERLTGRWGVRPVGTRRQSVWVEMPLTGATEVAIGGFGV